MRDVQRQAQENRMFDKTLPAVDYIMERKFKDKEVKGRALRRGFFTKQRKQSIHRERISI